jgi:hypothetical protein
MEQEKITIMDSLRSIRDLGKVALAEIISFLDRKDEKYANSINTDEDEL